MKTGVLEIRDLLETLLQSMAVRKDSECMTRAVEPATTIRGKVQDSIISSNTSKVIHIIMDHQKADMPVDTRAAAAITVHTAEIRKCIPEDMKAGQTKILTGASGMKAIADIRVAVIAKKIILAETKASEEVMVTKVHATETATTILNMAGDRATAIGKTTADATTMVTKAPVMEALVDITAKKTIQIVMIHAAKTGTEIMEAGETVGKR